MPKFVAIKHQACGNRYFASYIYQVDVFLNPHFCYACREEFFPFDAKFDEADDGSIREYENHLEGVTHAH